MKEQIENIERETGEQKRQGRTRKGNEPRDEEKTERTRGEGNIGRNPGESKKKKQAEKEEPRRIKDH